MRNWSIIFFGILIGTITEVHAENLNIIPQNTVIPIVIQSKIHSDTTKTGDPFEACTFEDVVINGNLAWPKGTGIKGTVIVFKPSKYKGSGMRLVFTDVNLSSGQRLEPLNADLVSPGSAVTIWRGAEKQKIYTSSESLCGPLFADANTIQPMNDFKNDLGISTEKILHTKPLFTLKNKAIDIRPGDITALKLTKDFSLDYSK